MLAALLGAHACVSPPNGSDHPPVASAAPGDEALEPLRAFEAARRKTTDFATLPASDATGGPDPYVVRALPGGGFVGVLRGRGALLVLDRSLREVQRLPAPESPSSLVVTANEVLVAGETTASVAR